METGTLIGIIIGSIAFFILLLYTLYWFYRRIRPKQSWPPLERREGGAFTILGNLVNEFSSPITDHYSITNSLLGRGSSAEVVIGEHLRQKRRYAIKIINLTNPKVIWRYDREKNFLKDIEHANIARLYEVYWAPTALFFVTDLCTGGHLGQALKHTKTGYFEEMHARKYILQVLGALIHCHQHGICHRDIKLQNILLEDHSESAQVKVIDFGNAVRFIGKTPLSKVVGTTYTAAPEVFRKCYDEKCDVWSLGVVAYILLCGRRPFERPEVDLSTSPPKNKENAIISLILTGRFHFKYPAWDEVSEDAMDFVRCCLQLDHHRRPSALSLLDHPWMVYQPPQGRQRSGLASPRNFSKSNSDRMSALSVGRDGSGSRDSGSDRADGGRNKTIEDVIGTFTISPRAMQVLRQLYLRHLDGKKAEARIFFMLAVVFLLPPARLRWWRDVFQEIDRNANGEIERDEFRHMMQLVEPQLTVREVDEVFDVIDQDQSGKVTLMEFLAATIDPATVEVPILEEAFYLLDHDHKGNLQRTDLLRILTTVISVDYYDEMVFLAASSSSLTLSSPFSEKGSPFPLINKKKANHSTNVLVEELLERQRLRRNWINTRVDHILEVVDLDRNGVISHTEFLFAMSHGSSNSAELNGAGEGNGVGETGKMFDLPPLSLLQQASMRGLDKLWPKRRQSDGVVRLHGAFQTRKRSSFLYKGRESGATLDTGGGNGGDGARGGFDGGHTITQGFMTTVPPTTSSFSCGWLRCLFPTSDQKVHTEANDVQFRGKDQEPLSFVEDSPIPDGPDRDLLSSNLPVGGLSMKADSPSTPPTQNNKQMRAVSSLESRPSLVRRLSSAFFAARPQRARARTTPALMWTYQLMEGGELRRVPNPAVVQDLLSVAMNGEGRLPVLQTQTRESDEDHVWMESEDSLDRTSFKGMEPERAEHVLEAIRRKSGGASLDSHLFRQQMMEQMMIVLPTSSKKSAVVNHEELAERMDSTTARKNEEKENSQEGMEIEEIDEKV